MYKRQEKDRQNTARQTKKFQFQETLHVTDLINWVEERRQLWNCHVDRMDNNRLVKRTRNRPKEKLNEHECGGAIMSSDADGYKQDNIVYI